MSFWTFSDNTKLHNIATSSPLSWSKSWEVTGTTLLALVPQNSESPTFFFSIIQGSEACCDIKAVTVKMVENSEQIHYSYGWSEATERGRNDDTELMVLWGCGRICFLSHKKSVRSILPVDISHWFIGIRLWNIYFGFPFILLKIINEKLFYSMYPSTVKKLFPLREIEEDGNRRGKKMCLKDYMQSYRYVQKS